MQDFRCSSFWQRSYATASRTSRSGCLASIVWTWALIGIPTALAAALGVLAIHANLSAPFHAAPETNALSGGRTGLVICSLDVLAIAVVLFKGRLRTVLDLWVTIALLASFADASLNLLSMVQFTLGWYVARVFSMLAPGVLVCVLVWEVTVLYRELSEAHASLLHTSTRDALTRVYNRSYFDDQFRREFDRATRNGQPLSLVMVDVDNFKDYNDAFGHLRGDVCLSAIAKALAGTARRSSDFVARYGGEEFAVVLPNTGSEEASVIAEQARLAIMQLGLTAPIPGGQVTISAGCATSEHKHAEHAQRTRSGGGRGALRRETCRTQSGPVRHAQTVKLEAFRQQSPETPASSPRQ